MTDATSVRAVQPVPHGSTVIRAVPLRDDGMAAMPATEFSTDCGCCESASVPGRIHHTSWRNHQNALSYWGCHGLPNPWHAPGNLYPHLGDAPNGITYYFRPYNWVHVSAQQDEAVNYGGDPHNPYDNRAVFDGLYDGL